jgi:hypothetical protein
MLFSRATLTDKEQMIDEKLIAAHQLVVDESERQPAWWAEHTAWAFLATHLTASLLLWKGGWDILSAVFGLVLGTTVIYATRSPVLLAMLGSKGKFLRLTLLALIVYYVVKLIMDPSISLASSILSMLLLLSSDYFAACQPPRPRKRSRSVSQGGVA